MYSDHGLIWRIERCAVAGLLFAGCLSAQSAPAAAAPPATLNQLMRGLFFPHSNVVFATQRQDPADIKHIETVAGQHGLTAGATHLGSRTMTLMGTSAHISKFFGVEREENSGTVGRRDVTQRPRFIEDSG